MSSTSGRGGISAAMSVGQSNDGGGVTPARAASLSGLYRLGLNLGGGGALMRGLDDGEGHG
jgi:hypothetical protein